MMHTLIAPLFTFSCDLEIFETDVQYPSNTILHVEIDSDGFRAKADLDIDIKSFAKFVLDLQQMSVTLKGTATIAEAFGNQNFIRFSVDHHGYILVKGTVDSCGRNGYFQKLNFENSFDQTFLSSFASELVAAYGKYLPT